MTDTIRLRFVRETFVSGDRFNVDDVADIPTADARLLIGMHRAERCDLSDEEIEAQAKEAEAAAKAAAAAEAKAKAKADAEAKAAADAAAKAEADAAAKAGK